MDSKESVSARMYDELYFKYLKETKRRKRVSNKKNNELTFQDVLKIMNHIYSKKNKEYGNSFEEAYRLYGDRAVGYVVTTKSRRIESLLTNPGEVNFESLEDSLLDLANYCVMGLMMLEEEKDNE